MKTIIQALLLVPLAFAGIGCDPKPEPDTEVDRGALLFGLDDEDVEAIHAAYVPDEDLALTRARLTAPFDCSLYDDFCEVVGTEAAEQITAETVELALEGAPLADIEANTALRIDEALALADEAEAEDEMSFRGYGAWESDVQGDYRLRVRHGILTPLVGQREALTQGKTEHREANGTWTTVFATQICVDTGPNTQTQYVHDASGFSSTVIESFDPMQICKNGVGQLSSTTYHDRLQGGSGGGVEWWYKISVNGCAAAQINGINFQRCPAEYSETF